MNETYRMDIAAPIERVWPLVADDENLVKWMDGLKETTYPDGLDKARAVGTRFVQRIQEGGRVQTYEGRVTAYDPPTHLGITVGNRAFAMQVDYRFTDLGGRTRLDYSALMVRAGFFVRMMSTLFGAVTRRILGRQMAKLKALAEAGA
jgi:uncharacterized protein YndB with AHSA1/START domain